MADKLSYLDELLVTPKETGFGTMGNIIAQNLPGLVNPYASPGANFATVLGGGLLAGLLKYGAKQEAESQNAALMPKLLDVMGATSQQELQTKLAQPGYEQLGSLGTRLSLTMAENQRAAALEAAKQKAQLENQKAMEKYKWTDKEIIEGKNALERAKQAAIAANREPKEAKPKDDWFQKIPAAPQAALNSVPGQVKMFMDLAQEWKDLESNALEKGLALTFAPNSKEALLEVRTKTLIPSLIKTLGDTGNIAVAEQKAQLENLLGGSLAGSQAIGNRLSEIALQVAEKNSAALATWKTSIEQGGDALLNQINQTAENIKAMQATKLLEIPKQQNSRLFDSLRNMIVPAPAPTPMPKTASMTSLPSSNSLSPMAQKAMEIKALYDAKKITLEQKNAAIEKLKELLITQ